LSCIAVTKSPAVDLREQRPLREDLEAVEPFEGMPPNISSTVGRKTSQRAMRAVRSEA